LGLVPADGRTAEADTPPPTGTTALAGGTTHATGEATAAIGEATAAIGETMAAMGVARGSNAGAAETATMRAVAGMKSLFIMAAVGGRGGDIRFEDRNEREKEKMMFSEAIEVLAC
jgi:hypothetical protein